jgi:5-methylcytosine-specific restriction endonuclease McrA
MPYKKLRQQVFEKYNGHCAYCGVEIAPKEMQIDHIVPQRSWIDVFRNKHIDSYFRKFVPEFLEHLTEFDLHHVDNLNPACRVCNKWKSAHYLELFRSELQDQVNRLNARSANFRIAKRFNQLTETETPIIFYFETFTNKSKNP